MGFLTPEESAIVARAQHQKLLTERAPAYLPPNLCIVLSLLLAVPSLGFSLLFVPILWVVQHDHTARRIAALQQKLEGMSGLAGMPAGTEAA